MSKHRCDVCGYVYDSKKGQPATGVKSNTEWDDVPADWKCPVCGVGKEHFTEEN